MKSKSVFLIQSLVFSIILLSFNGCKDSILDDCTPEDIEFTTIEIVPSCDLLIVDEKLEDRFLMINSKEELDGSVIFNDSYPDNPCEEIEMALNKINFSDKTLLIGKKVVQGIQPSLINHNFTRTCENNELIYSLNIKNGGYTAIGVYRFAVVVPKQVQAIKFDVKVTK